MTPQEGTSAFCRIGTTLIDWNSVEFTYLDEQTKHMSIAFKSGYVKLFDKPSEVTALLRYIKLYPDMLDPKTMESLMRYSNSLKSKIQTDIPQRGGK